MANADTAPGRASLPQDWFEEPGHENTTYVRVGSGKQAFTLIAQPLASARGREIRVAPGTLGLGANGTAEVQAVPLSVGDLRRQRAKEAIAGIGSNLTIGLMSAFYPFMQILGAVLVFIKAAFFGTTP